MQYFPLIYYVHTIQFHCDEYFYMFIIDYNVTKYHLNIGARLSIQSNLYITTLGYTSPQQYDEFFVDQKL